VKRKATVVAAALATLGVAVYLGSRLWAQAPAAPAQAPAQTRIALVNTLHVVKSYGKFKAFDEEMRRLAKPFEDRDKQLKDNLKQWQDALQNPALDQATRDKAEKEIKERKRQVEDNALEAKKVLGKRHDEGFVQLYREVEDAVKRYAVSNGYHIVLQFDERTNPADVHSMPNIQRKLQGCVSTGCCLPLYIAPGLDITQNVITTLNGAAAAAPGGAAPAAARPAGN
jgi:Skp family chaperone for outer membrane proteins